MFKPFVYTTSSELHKYDAYTYMYLHGHKYMYVLGHKCNTVSYTYISVVMKGYWYQYLHG